MAIAICGKGICGRGFSAAQVQACIREAIEGFGFPGGFFCPHEVNKFVAILSTTVLPLDGTYRVETLPPGEVPDITGVPHYIGHPDTKQIVEGLGAVPTSTKLFPGQQVGEQVICFPIAQGKSTRAVDGFTSPHQTVDLADLQVRVITRLE